jgi:alpha-mannosidase
MKRRSFLGVSSAAVIGLSLSGNLSGAAETINAGNRKRIYLALDDHTDYMWTGDEKTYHKAFLDMLDYYVESTEKTAQTEPPDFQNRFSGDGSLWLRIYEQNRTPEQFDRLINCIKSGHITIPVTVLTLCYGAMPAEAVIRSMYYAGTLERRHNLSFPLALPMEDQTMPYGLGSLFAGAGAKYCWMGICGCASRMDYGGKRPHDIYWWTGLDGSKVLIKWNSLLTGDNRTMGGYAEARRPSETINYVDTDIEFNEQYPYDIIGIFGKGWDDLTTMTEDFIATAKQETTKDRRIIVSNEIDFFEDFEASYGDDLPSFSAAFGNEWDLYSASMSELSARIKRSVEKLRSAEALATLVNLHDSDFLTDRSEDAVDAYNNMGLYWNHDWTADGSVVNSAEYSAWARKTVRRIESYVDTLHDDSRKALGGMIKKSGKRPRFYAFNPLGWKRTDVVEYAYADDSPFHIIDTATGKETPSQAVKVGSERRIRLIAEDVPPVGYKIFEIRPGKGKISIHASENVSAATNVIENKYYRITVRENGSISSLIDKKNNNRELVININNRTVNDLGAGSGSLEIEDIGPVSATIKAVSAAPVEHTTRITLFNASDRISISNEITENFGSTGDYAPHWAFGFNLDSPDIWHEETGAVINAKLSSQGGHYSPTHARYDWLSANHFADISDPTGYGVTLSNADCCFMKTGVSTLTDLDSKTPQVNMLAGGQIDGPQLGIPSQGGDSYFLQRFAIQTHTTFSKAAAMRFSLEHQNPIVCGAVTGGMAYPESEFSLMDISDPDLLLWALKPHHDGIADNGIVARLWNMSENQSDFGISIPNGSVLSAEEMTHIETPLRKLAVSNKNLNGTISPNRIQSFGLKISL